MVVGLPGQGQKAPLPIMVKLCRMKTAKVNQSLTRFRQNPCVNQMSDRFNRRTTECICPLTGQSCVCPLPGRA